MGQGSLNRTSIREQLTLTTFQYDRGSGACSGQNEGGEKDTVFVLEDGATLRNVIIGKNQAEGVYCLGYVLTRLRLTTKHMLTTSQRLQPRIRLVRGRLRGRHLPEGRRHRQHHRRRRLPRL